MMMMMMMMMMITHVCVRLGTLFQQRRSMISEPPFDGLGGLYEYHVACIPILFRVQWRCLEEWE